MNRSWSGRITSTELRRSSFLQVGAGPGASGQGLEPVGGASMISPIHPQNVKLLEVEPDINQLTEFFSYEHFYVIYCKFWELDTDHDLQVDARDLGRHSDHGEGRDGRGWT